MTNKIDPIKLKAAAEHLEWVCQQYPNEEKVQGLYKALQPVIAEAKAEGISMPLAGDDQLPFFWAVSAEGLFDQFSSPSVGDAYVQLAIQLRGGLTEQEQRINARIAAMRARQEAERKRSS